MSTTDEAFAVGIYDYPGNNDDATLAFKQGERIKLLGCNPGTLPFRSCKKQTNKQDEQQLLCPCNYNKPLGH